MIYVQEGAIDKNIPSFATKKAKIEKLTITPKANNEEKIKVNFTFFSFGKSLLSPTALPTKSGTLKSEQGARLVIAPASKAPKNNHKKLAELSSSKT